MIHAFPLSSEMWVAAIAELQMLLPGLDVACLDAPGFGLSSLDGAWTMSSTAEEIFTQLEALHLPPPVICGLSMGGYIALALHQAHPNYAAGYILSNTKSAADTEEGKRDRESFALEVLASGSIVAVEKQLDKLVGPTTIALRTAIREQVRDWILAAKPEAIAEGLRAMALRGDTTSILPTIKQPTLVIAAAEDGICPPAEMRAMSQAIRSAQFEELSAVGHLSAIETPARWAGIVAKFLLDL